MQPKVVQLLEENSRTFLVPIMQAPKRLQDAVGSAYLCMRAIDEIEDHEKLPAETKGELLRGIADTLEKADGTIDHAALDELFNPHTDMLPEVTLQLGEVAEVAPPDVRKVIWKATADMARDMAAWAESRWEVSTQQDLDNYTFAVAGRVGLLLSHLWRWHDGTECGDEESIGFGRALQAVNIVRNREEDLLRNVDFFPDGWKQSHMITYTRRQIALADAYLEKLPSGVVHDFCIVPLELAKATLDAIESGREKLTRSEVVSLIESLRV